MIQKSLYKTRREISLFENGISNTSLYLVSEDIYIKLYAFMSTCRFIFIMVCRSKQTRNDAINIKLHLNNKILNKIFTL